LGLREEKKEQTRRQILDTADELFRSKGYGEARVADICQQVRISEKTFFNYFRSKEAVLTELAVEWFHRNGQADSPSERILYEFMTRYQEKCEGFRQAQKHGKIRDDVPAEEITGYYSALRNSIVGAWLREEEARPGELEERVMRALDVLLSGLKPRDPGQPGA
jgi:AcrR family transcriptional regulator